MIRALLVAATLAAGAVALLVLVLVAGTHLDPAGSLWGVIGSVVWAPFGPFLLLAALLAVVVGAVARWKGLRRIGGAVALVGLAGLAGSAVILGRIGAAGNAAGVEFDIPAMFRPAPMDQPVPDAVEAFRTVEGTDLRAAIYRPPPSVGPAPVLVYIHGGGFMAGTFTETAADLRWVADRGWLVVSVEYRLFAPDFPTWNRAPEDVACALVWVARNAGRFGGDAARIALAGDSAGGNLAINLGHAAASGRAPGPCGAEVPVPAAIATLYPAVDPLSIYRKGYPVPGFEPRMLIEGYLGGPPDAHPDRVGAVASAGYLTAEGPPTLVVLPERDSLVVAEGTLAFVEEARRTGAKVELVTIPYANHVFNQITAGSPGNQIGRSLRLRFLETHVR